MLGTYKDVYDDVSKKPGETEADDNLQATIILSRLFKTVSRSSAPEIWFHAADSKTRRQRGYRKLIFIMHKQRRTTKLTKVVRGLEMFKLAFVDASRQ